MVDNRPPAWGDEGLEAITRTLLLGRLVDGMLHDLAQPLNVISMACGNADYLIEHLDIDRDSRRQLAERIARIARQTESAANTLALFRGLGRAMPQGDEERADARRAQPSVGRALERAIAATRSTARHRPAVMVTGGALGHPVEKRQSTLEILCVAALISAFGAFIDPSAKAPGGSVLLRAETDPAHVVAQVQCTDGAGDHLPCKPLDGLTLWHVERLAREAGGDFAYAPRGAQPTEIILRLARDDI